MFRGISELCRQKYGFGHITYGFHEKPRLYVKPRLFIILPCYFFTDDDTLFITIDTPTKNTYPNNAPQTLFNIR